MLEKVGFKNFLALRDVEIDLEPFTVIVGPNSSGKSTILEGIRRLTSINDGTPVAFFNINAVDRGNSIKVSEAIEFVRSKSSNSEPAFSFLEENRHTFVTLFQDRGWKYSCKTVGGVFDELKTPFVALLNDSTSLRIKTKPVFVSFSFNSASKPSYTRSEKPTIEKDGKGLATICSDLQQDNTEVFTQIQENLKKIVPSLKRIRIKRASVSAENWFNISNQKEHISDVFESKRESGQELFFDFDGAASIPATQVSEGTLFALTIFVAAASSSEDTVMLIDDLERGLHPKAVRELVEMLREIQKLKPGLQIIATSHSPYVLHSLKPNEVRVVTLDPERGTLVAPLEAYPEFDKWRDAMTPGEFWSFVGEDWVKDLPALEKTSV